MKTISKFNIRPAVMAMLSLVISCPVDPVAALADVEKTHVVSPAVQPPSDQQAQLAMNILGGHSKKSKKSQPDKTTSHKAPEPETHVPASQPVPISVPEKPAVSGTSGEAPVLVPDAALISLMKDLDRELKESADVEKLEDACHKDAAHLASQALSQALSGPHLRSNRIILPADKARAESTMTAEAWESGDIVLSRDCRASLTALWAKKIDGLINLQIAGDCGCKAAPDGHKVGQFVFVLSGKSTVDKGFDIQTQADVNFWLGKISSFTVDTKCCSDAQAGLPEGVNERRLASTLVLKAVLTDQARKYLADQARYKEEQQQIALKEEKERKQAEDKAEAQAKAKAEAVAKAEAEAKALDKARTEQKAGPPASTPLKAENLAEARAQAEQRAQQQEKSSMTNPLAAAMDSAAASNRVAMAAPAETSPGSQKGWDSPPAAPDRKAPSSAARLLLPDKAIAGQFLTAAVLNQSHAAEPLIELSFNGAPLATGQDGRALFQVPEDAVPGPSLQVGLSARPDLGTTAVSVIQPLSLPSGPQIPRVDMVSPVVQAGGMIVIDGHNFDGVADRNRAIVDGMYDARVLVSSPVQLKADLPANLIPGEHSVSISTADLRSNPGQFEVISVDVQPDPKEVAKDALSKLIVRAIGTKNQIRVHLKNYTPDVIKLVRGDEQFVLTPGGPNNAIGVGVKRLRKGNYHVQATIE